MAKSKENSSSEVMTDEELLRQVTDLVYKMLLRDSQLDYERRRSNQLNRPRFGGQ